MRWVFGDLTCRIPVCFNETAWDGVGEQIDIWEFLVKRGAIKVIRMPFDTGKVRRFREWFERNNRFIGGSGRPIGDEEFPIEITAIPPARKIGQVSSPSVSSIYSGSKVDTSRITEEMRQQVIASTSAIKEAAKAGIPLVEICPNRAPLANV
ncbi:MAG: hypothetical protein ABH886_04860 [Candidatus Desantisbacteria bacterium]